MCFVVVRRLARCGVPVERACLHLVIVTVHRADIGCAETADENQRHTQNGMKPPSECWLISLDDEESAHWSSICA